MALFRNSKTSRIMIWIFVAALFGSLAFCSQKAEASDLWVEGGAAIVQGEAPVLGLSGRWIDAGPAKTDIEAGFVLVGESEHSQKNSNAVTVYGMIWAQPGTPKAQLGIGFAYTNVEQEYTCRGTFSLGARWQPLERLSIQARHFSSAGSCEPNAGRNLLTASWRF